MALNEGAMKFRGLIMKFVILLYPNKTCINQQLYLMLF